MEDLVHAFRFLCDEAGVSPWDDELLYHLWDAGYHPEVDEIIAELDMKDLVYFLQYGSPECQEQLPRLIAFTSMICWLGSYLSL